MGKVNCRTGVSLGAALNACPLLPVSLGLEKEKKPKILLYPLLYFFPFNTLNKKYATPDSPSMLVVVRTN